MVTINNTKAELFAHIQELEAHIAAQPAIEEATARDGEIRYAIAIGYNTGLPVKIITVLTEDGEDGQDALDRISEHATANRIFGGSYQVAVLTSRPADWEGGEGYRVHEAEITTDIPV